MRNEFQWPSGKELEVLNILRCEPRGMYGLQIVDKSNGAVSRSAIYVVLGRLEEKGFVKRVVPKSDSHPGMPRPIYSLTGDGARVVDAAASIALGRARA